MAEAVSEPADVNTVADDKHFVDEHKFELINRVSNPIIILDQLLSKDVIDQQCYNEITALHPSHMMRALFSGPLKSSGVQGKDIFYQVLSIYEPLLIARLEKMSLNEMNRTDLEQRLLDISSGTKEKKLSLTQRVESMVSVVELLLATLAGLGRQDFWKFKKIVNQSYIKDHELSYQDLVFSIVQHFGQQSVEKVKKMLKNINRTDLVQRLLSGKPESQRKYSVDEQPSVLIHKVATMAAVKDLLLEIFNDVSDEELKNLKWFLQFKFFHSNIPYMSWEDMLKENTAKEVVDVLVKMCGQKSVDETVEVFVDMNRTDLVQRLSESSSGFRAGSSAGACGWSPTEGEKNSLYERWPGLVEEEKTLASLIELLLDSLKDLNEEELRNYMDTTMLEAYNIPLMPPDKTNLQDIVFFVVQRFGKQALQKTEKYLLKIRKTLLVQRLSHSSSGHKKKFSADQHHSSLIKKVATVAAVKQLLLGILDNLSSMELDKFKRLLQLTVYQKNLQDIFRMLNYTEDRAYIADKMVQVYGQQSVELTMDVLKKMNRTDLFQSLAPSSTGLEVESSKDEHHHTLFKRAAARRDLLKTLECLSPEELEKFRWLLEFTCFQRSFPLTSRSHRSWAKSPADALVDVMMESHGLQSMEVTKDVFMDMKRTDLVQMLSETISWLKVYGEGTSTSLHKKLHEKLENLDDQQLKEFKWYLPRIAAKKGFKILHDRIWTTSTTELAMLMIQMFGEQSLEVIREVLEDYVLEQKFSNISLGSKGSSRSLKPEDCGSLKDSSGWTKQEPEVSSTDADETPTYSLKSEAGNFECCVSGLRWFCKAKVSFKYQFCSWDEPMERMERLQYMPAGPLMNITVITGKLDEVYLPHWICIDDSSEISDKFAVLHINDCGDEVEKVSEVTTSHVKLTEPKFSAKGLLIKFIANIGDKFKRIKCNVLIYKTIKTFLTLHVYLTPRDPGKQQEIERGNPSFRNNMISKPHPETSLKLGDRFILKADFEGAQIDPENIELQNERGIPNFFEVYIENPDRNFSLSLIPNNEAKDEAEAEAQPVWTAVIRRGDYPSTGPTQGEHYVDKYLCYLIERVSNIDPILDNLLSSGVIQQESYAAIRAIPTTQEKMRALYCGPLKAGGLEAKDIFYKILEEKESYLVKDLKKMDA